MQALSINLATALCLVAVTIVTSSGSIQASPEMQTSNNSFSYGYVYVSKLSNLASTKDRAAYVLLTEGHTTTAIPALQQELAKNPNSLVAYVGLMQVEPERWGSEIDSLRAKVSQQYDRHQQPASADLLKLGTLLYYQRDRDPNLLVQPRFDKQEIEARKLLKQAWNNNHSPIVGLMLMEALTTAGFTSASSNESPTPIIIGHQLIKDLAGPEVLSQYLYARNYIWNTQPPPISLVPKQNLRSLLAVMASVRSLYGQRSGVLTIVDGKPVMTDNPVPASQLAHERYLKAWYNNLVAALKT